MTTIGTVARICRYPVKGMAGHTVRRAFVGYSGLIGDRVYAMLAFPERRFPWFTARQMSVLLRYRPRFPRELDPERPILSAQDFELRVSLPDPADGREVDIDVLVGQLSERFGAQIELVFSERPMHDSRPISVIGDDTIGHLSRDIGAGLDPWRFRANFYVKWLSEKPFFEDSLVGRELAIGDGPRFLLVKRDRRCKVVDLNPASAEADVPLLQLLNQKHDGCAGVYAVVLRQGIVEEGASITLA